MDIPKLQGMLVNIRLLAHLFQGSLRLGIRTGGHANEMPVNGWGAGAREGRDRGALPVD